MIFKIQKPLHGNAPDWRDQWLAYNEDRSIIVQMTPPDWLVELFKESSLLKVYAECEVSGKTVTVLRPVDNQPW